MRKPLNLFHKVSAFVVVGVVGALLIGANQSSVAAENDLRAKLLSIPLNKNLGGDGTVSTTGPRAFRSINAAADNANVAPFLFGQRVFDAVWEEGPGGVQPTLEGLGPLFNRRACRECHEGNGKGQPPENVGDPMKSILVRMSVPGTNAHGGPKNVPNYGDQLQNMAVPGIAAEGQAIFTYEEIPGKFGDGTPYSLRKPTVEFVNMAYGDLPADTMASARVAAPVIGLGLLANVPEATLRALADPDDANGDGISGHVNWAWDANSQRMAVGRFGWKANVPSLRHQNAGAALGDMGLTSPVFGTDLCESVQKDCLASAAEKKEIGVDPEILDSFFSALEIYMLLLAVPEQRGADEPAVQRGEALFRGVGCSNCHMPTLITGKSGWKGLSEQEIHPFTDLLVHDMGEGLADNRPDYAATGSEWRTAPLWGVGLTYDVGRFHFYLHDGRARSLSEAILWHGGEAEPKREAFRNMPKAQREDLLAFLGSL